MAAFKAANTTSISTSPATNVTSTTLANSDNCHNFHDLCRSCGKTNAELYDLFHTTNSSNAATSSPFNTSSTTCYAHLNNNACSSAATSTANACSKSTAGLTFDSLAATAKATAKGQSNMDNILQEMQIWQLMIKCNDGLPQRICAKCTAQFYMIHKFRRKCLKVQTQLRALNEEQKIYERQQQQQEHATPAASLATVATATAPLAKEGHDLVSDNRGEQQQAAVDNTKSAAVSFETNTGNTDATSTRATTLPDNVVQTMPQKTEANEPTTKPTSAQDQATLARPKDEKKPLLKAAVLKCIKTPPLQQQPLQQQICDNEATTSQTNANKTKQCPASHEKMLETDPTTDTSIGSSYLSPLSVKNVPNLKQLPSKQQPESLFITKAALKAYTVSLAQPASAANVEAKNANDGNNNNGHRHNLPYSQLSDRLSRDNRCTETDNTCSSTSSSTQSPCSSKSSNISRKSYLQQRKAVKYPGNSKRSGLSYKSSAITTSTTTKKLTKLTLKRKQRSWQNKHKLKRLVDIRTCSSASATRKQRQSKTHKMFNNNKKSQPLQLEDETSTSTVSTISSSTSTPSSSATTPAVTDLVETHTNTTCHYGRNTNEENLNKTGSSSIAEEISSNKSCIMWKTKAAMKANANDMPVDANVNVHVTVANKAEPTSHIAAISSSFPCPAAETTPTGSTSLEATKTATDKSSKTLDENQSISSSTTSTTNTNHNNNNILMEQQPHCSTNMAQTSPDNQVKDTGAQNLKHNLWQEGAQHKQIKAFSQESDEKEFSAINMNTEQEMAGQVMEKEQQQKPTALTPKTGGMKLIIQRKRGARFRCLRKSDDDDPPTIQDNEQPTTPKRRKKSCHNNMPHTKLGTESLFLPVLNTDYLNEDEDYTENNQNKRNYFHSTTSNSDVEDNVNNNTPKRCKVPEFNSEEDENKENPIVLQQEFDSDNSNSIYRDPLLIRNDMLEEDTQLTDFPKPQLSLQSECSKEMYKLYKEKVNLESPKKLIIRVPLTSLTQDFKRLHLTMDQEPNEENELVNETANEEPQQTQHIANEQEHYNEATEETPTQTIAPQQEETPNEQITSSEASQSDLMGFSQPSESSSSTVDSSQQSIEMIRYVPQPLCSASSKINDFINDFQNNCIDSSEIDETCEMVPHLGPRVITQQLSDEIRDVEDTLNGILSEMHDKDMYTPRSGTETDELFPHSVYSPLTDSPTTPSHSFYAESPCTINSNPMSVSPFIHHNMDYNAMTPQSNHSSMGHSSHMGGSVCGSVSGSASGGSTGSHPGVFSEHFPTYTECFEESTESELIGFQNDIPCFENIEITPVAASDLLATTTEFNDEEKVAIMTETNDSNVPSSVTESVEVKASPEIVDYIDLSDYKENSEQLVETQPTAVQVDAVPEIAAVSNTNATEIQAPSFNSANNYQQVNNTPTIQMQNSANTLMTSNTTTTQPHYIVTNTNQGPIIIANPRLNQTTTEQMDGNFKPHSNNLQFVTLGQAMEANQAPTNHLIQNNTTEINWPTAVNATANYTQQPVISTANGTTTYFINANGELYQASIPTSSLNTIIVPNNTAQPMDSNDNYMQTLQQRHQQPQHQNNAGQSSQYIMLVNNLGGTPQYYATTHTNLNQTVHASPQPTVLYSANQSNANTNPPPATKTKSTHVPISPALETDPKTGQSMHQRVNQQLQRQIKQRQLQLLQPRSANVTQKITLVCRFCHKRPKFTNNVDYSNHIINTHPAEKPYNCPHCPMHFTRRSERQQHVAQVHGSRYQCAQCGLSFCAQRTLDFHLQKYHANLGRSHQLLQQQQQQQQKQQQQNSTSTSSPATYQLLQHNQRQRLVRVEDVHVKVTGENKNKRSIDLSLNGSADIKTSQSMPEVELLSGTTGTQQQEPQKHSRKLCSPDCNDDDDCCGSNKNHDQTNNNNNAQAENTAQQQYAGNESVKNNQHHQHQHQHVTIPSPEQTEPDSTTTLRHFRKRQLSEISPHFATSPTSSSFNNNSNGNNDNSNSHLNHNSPDNVLTDDIGSGGGGDQIVAERSLRGTHNCLLCEESFTNEIALRKHHHLTHGAAAQTTNATSSSSTTSALVCTICKRGFRMRNALQRHMETHDAEGRPYECNICQVRFPRPSQLTLHKLTVHKFEKPNSCEQCGKLFGTETAMKAHAKEHQQCRVGKEAASASTAQSSEASTTTSTSSSSSAPQLSSRIYLATKMTTKTITKEQNINLQSTTSGEDETTASNNNANNAACNNNTIVSGLAT